MRVPYFRKLPHRILKKCAGAFSAHQSKMFNKRTKAFAEADAGLGGNIGALIIRMGFRGPLCYSHNKEPPK